MPRKAPVTTSIDGQLVFLGTGTSVGVPTIGCGCEVCVSCDPKNHRTRCSIVLGLPQGNLLVDTSTDLRTQLLREKIGIIHAVVYTHEHADHIFGLDDLRLMPFYLGHAVPLYCTAKVEKRIRQSFDYAFADRELTHPGAVPQLDIRRVTCSRFDVLGFPITPIRLLHGPQFEVLGFRFANVAYCTDTNQIPEESWPLLEGLDVLILDALRPQPHATHFGLEQAVEVAKTVAPRRTFFTHISHELDYHATNEQLPVGMELAYDGMRIPIV